MSRATARSREPLSSASAQRCPAACTAPSGAAREQPNPHSPHRLALGVDGLAGALRIIAATERICLLLGHSDAKPYSTAAEGTGSTSRCYRERGTRPRPCAIKILGKDARNPNAVPAETKATSASITAGHFRRGARAVCGDRTAQLGASSVFYHTTRRFWGHSGGRRAAFQSCSSELFSGYTFLRVVMGWQARWTPGTFPGLCATSAATTFWQRRIRPREACVVCESRLRISEVRQSLAQKQNFRERGRDSK